MAPSSLIFVVIVGVWAAFFVQYWIRRREHIATARSVDAFTETMRVLKLRDPEPRVDLSAPMRASYAVSPLRSARPQVTVKRAHSLLADAGGRDEGAVAESPSVGGGGPALGRPGRGPVLAVTRATKGLTLLLGLVGTLVYALLSLTGVLVVWAPLVPLLVAASGLAWLRADVRAALAQRAPVRNASVSGASVKGASVRGASVKGASVREASGRRPGPRADVAPARTSVDAGAQATAPAERAPLTEVYDIAAATATSAPNAAPTAATPPGSARPTPAAARRALLDEDDMPLTWDPVPVPRPTYTMKAAAVRVPALAETPAPRPVLGEVDDDVPEFFPLPRRAVGG